MSVSVRVTWLLLVTAVLLSRPGLAEEKDVETWLRGMVEAVRSLDYQGTFVYLHDNHLESLQLVHTVDENGERERLVSLNGAAREVLRDNASVTCVAPDARSVQISGRSVAGGFRSLFAMNPEKLANSYRFQLSAKSRIAGRETQLVEIEPVDSYRYGYRLYLDREHGLPLKTDLLDSTSGIVSQIMFTSIEIGADNSRIHLVTDSLEGRENYRWQQRKPMWKLAAEDTKSRWKFEQLPPGFQLSLQAWQPAGVHQSEVGHYVLSDGLASLSVYIEQAALGEGLEGGSNMGAVNAFGRRIGDHLVTAVGSVPAVTVQQVANAVRRVD